MLPTLPTLDSKLFGIDSMSYLAKADISTLLDADITTLLLQGGHPVPTKRSRTGKRLVGTGVPTLLG